MTGRLLTAALLIVAAAELSAQPAAHPQPQPQRQSAIPNPQSAIKRMPDGHPDLQGTYDLGTLTPLERAPGTPLVLTDEEAAKRERQTAERNDKLAAPVDANRAAPPKGGGGRRGPGRRGGRRTNRPPARVAPPRPPPPRGGDGSPGPYGNVGGYNNFWLDPGSRYTVIDGQRRASLLIDPPDGRVPPLTADAQKRRASN